MKNAEVIYQIGEFQFLVNRNLLIQNGTQQKLEQMQADILMIFIQHHKSIISRELLEDKIWGTRIVTEQSINNKISELRKLFADNYRNPHYFKTHHKLGYELIADCVQVSPIKEEKKSTKTTKTTKTKSNIKALLFFIVVCITFVFGYWLISSNELAPLNENQKALVSTSINFKAITSEKGQEWSPSISSDGKYLAYAHRSNEQSSWQIKIKNLSTDETRTITKKTDDALSPIWHPNTNTLYFIKTINQKCTIWQASNVLTKPKISQLTTCGNISSISPLAIDSAGEWLYFSKTNEQSRFVISRFNIINKTTETLTTPPITDIGDYSLALSPDNKYLAFIRAETQAQSKLMLLNIRTRELLILNTFNHNIFKLSWQSNNEIIYINNKNSLVSFNIKTKENALITTFQNKTLAPMYAKDNFFIVDGNFFNSDIYSINITTELNELDKKLLISSSYQDYDLVFKNNKETFIFTSNRNGTPQIWIKNNSKITRLTNFQDFAYISDKQFSLTYESILFLRDDVPFIFDLSTNTISKPLIEFKHSASPIWSCDNKSILISSKNNGSWNLYQIDINSLAITKILSHVTSIKSDCSNSSYYVFLENKDNLFKLNKNMLSAISILPDHNFQYIHDWHISNGIALILDEDNLRRINLKSGGSSSVLLPYSGVDNFTLYENRLYFSQQLFKETHIKQVIKNQY